MGNGSIIRFFIQFFAKRVLEFLIIAIECRKFSQTEVFALYFEFPKIGQE